MVPESGLRTVTVSWTYGVSHPRDSGMRTGGQRRRVELLTLPCATQPSNGSEGGAGGFQGPKPLVKRPRPDEDLPIVDKPLIADALGLEGRGEEIAHVGVSRLAQHQRAVNGAQHVPLLSAAIGGERDPRGWGGDRVGLVLRLGPSRRLWEVRAQSLADARATQRCRTC